MPRKYMMSWEGTPNYRWVKMHKGIRYRITCDDLRVPRTKDGSYQAANEWWRSQLATLNAPNVDADQAEDVESLTRKIEYAANEAPELVASLEATKKQLLSEAPGEITSDDDSVIAENLELARLMGVVVPPDLDPTVLQHIFGNRRIWQERLRRHRRTEANKTVGFQLDRFLDEQRPQQKPATHRELAAYLKRLLKTKVWAADTNVETIDEQTVTRHYMWLVSQKFVPSRHNKLLGFFRRFVEWLWASGLLPERPRNLRLKSHRKKIKHKAVKRFSEVKQAIDALPMPYKLWALLALNCGMTEADLGETEWGQINQEDWTLTRRRTKTGDDPSTPTVTYKLWPETIVELKRLPHRQGLLFVTSTGRPLYETRYRDDNNVAVKDLFSTYWQRLDPKPAITLGKFRSVGATTLKSDKLYRQYEEYYLAHAPSKMSDRHYGAEDDASFFKALGFIRKEMGYPKKKSSR
jgi:integrase